MPILNHEHGKNDLCALVIKVDRLGEVCGKRPFSSREELFLCTR
jgi:hypothetical protein